MPQTSSPKFTVFIPVVKTLFFKEAFDSAVAQTFDDYEIVVLDNKADADVTWVKSKPRVRYHENEYQLPPVENWNAGLRLCRGEFVILLSDDDFLTPDCLCELARFIEKHAGLEVIRFLRSEIYHNGVVHRFSAPGAEVESIDQFIYYQYTFHRGLALSDYAFRRATAIEIGGYRNFPKAWATDQLLAVEIGARKNKIGNLNKPLLCYRFNGENLSTKTHVLEKMTADYEYFKYTASLLESIASSYQPLAVKSIKSRLQGMQDLHFTSAFLAHDWSAVCGLYKIVRRMGTSRSRSLKIGLSALVKFLLKIRG
jgi:glycosyltransferase involved in cell wall biosynthesis